MKVALISRSTLHSVPGGDTVQIAQTAAGLTAMGITADIKLSHQKIDYSAYDLIHFFNIIRPADILRHSQKAGKPYLVSTILCNYNEFDQQHRKGLGAVFSYMNNDSIEYVKTMARFALGRDKLASPAYIWRGHRKSINDILSRATLLLPNSESEYHRLQTAYNCNTNYMVVPNGININLFKYDAAVEKDDKLVLCAARIEGNKNQLNLIKALNNTAYNLVLIGSAAPSQLSYYKECRGIAAANIRFIDRLPQEQLLAYYQKAKVHVLPSYFETTGLSSMEAAAMGCNIVITDKGDTREYFGDDAFYCNPSLPQSILEAVDRASAAINTHNLRHKILQNYTWQHAASQTLKAYQQAIA